MNVRALRFGDLRKQKIQLGVIFTDETVVIYVAQQENDANT